MEGIVFSWKQLGQDINGKADLDQSGWLVALPPDDKTLAIGSFLDNRKGDKLGHVRVFNIA